jgi:hypothetical protein
LIEQKKESVNSKTSYFKIRRKKKEWKAMKIHMRAMAHLKESLYICIIKEGEERTKEQKDYLKK